MRHPDKSHGPVRILIAEDSPTQAQRLKHTLENHGYEVSATSNGRQALEMARTKIPSLIMSDIIMPEMNGYQLCRQIKTEPNLKHLPVILVTTLADPQDVIRGLESGADNFIVKPYDEASLLERIQSVLLSRTLDDDSGTGVEINFNGHQHLITADRRQILNLLLSTYEAAIQRNQELVRAKDDLRAAIASHEAANAELARANERLQVEIKERQLAEQQLNMLNDELISAKHAADAANESKSAFLANMSHEIRTPMTSIIGYADLMFDPQQTEAQRRHAVHTIRRNGEHLLSIINDILDLSKIEAGKFTVERVECRPGRILNEVVSLMRVRATEKQLNLEAGIVGAVPLMIRSDAARLRQVLLNLVGNAIKFTKQGGVAITMKLERSSAALSRLRFDIRDTGIGITEEQLSRLFSPFVQADGSTSREFGGTGLGLAISKRLAELLGGRIEVVSSPGQGSTFSLIMDTGSLEGVPEVTDYREALAADEPATMQASSIRLSGSVLLVDDGRDNRDLLSIYLNRAGAQVTIAENGRIGYDKAIAAWIAGKPFDVIVMDMQMPVLDGYSAAAMLREQRYPGSIIALTAHAMAEDRAKCLNAGCTDYLRKPVNRIELLQMVAGYINTSKSLRTTSMGDAAVASPSVVPLSQPASPSEKVPIRSDLTDEGLRQLLDTFIRELPEKVCELESCLARRDLTQLSEKVHNLQGTGGLYGLMPITHAAARVERLIAACATVDAIGGEVKSLIEIIRRVEGFDARTATSDQRASDLRV